MNETAAPAKAAGPKPTGAAQRLLSQANILLPGLYAWGSTVAVPATQRGAPGLARATAFVALVALVTGPFLVDSQARVGRWVGLVGFVAASLATWLALGPLIGVHRLEPLRAGLGAVGWALFAVGWGDVRPLGAVPEDDPHVIEGPALPARSKIPKSATFVLAAAIVLAITPLFVAWRELRPEHALFAHAAAVLWAVVFVSAAARIAVHQRGRPQSVSVARRFAGATRPLALLILALGAGLLWAALL